MKRVTLFAGHYGSGKTNIAVNYAEHLATGGKAVTVVDLDIVNPYFRTKDSEEEFKAMGIELISSAYANTNLDAPALPKEIYSAVSDKSRYLIMDIGGDDRGAVALGRYKDDIINENNYEFIFVANMYRPLTRTAQDAVEVMREIEEAAHMKFTAMVNNSNLGDQTRAEDVLASSKYIDDISDLTGLKCIFTSVWEGMADKEKIENAFTLKLQKKYFDIKKG